VVFAVQLMFHDLSARPARVRWQLARLWSLHSKEELIFVLDEQKDERTMTWVKNDNNQNDMGNNCKDVKAHLFGANLQASMLRRSRNVSVLFHVRQWA
jgi:hypothetical protein